MIEFEYSEFSFQKKFSVLNRKKKRYILRNLLKASTDYNLQIDLCSWKMQSELNQKKRCSAFYNISNNIWAQ